MQLCDARLHTNKPPLISTGTRMEREDELVNVISEEPRDGRPRTAKRRKIAIVVRSAESTANATPAATAPRVEERTGRVEDKSRRESKGRADGTNVWSELHKWWVASFSQHVHHVL